MAEVGRTQFKTNTSTLYPDNTSGEISPLDLRAQMDNIADSTVFKSTGRTSPPGPADDSAGTSGTIANVGDIWVDETNGNVYVSYDDSVSAAQWALIGGDAVVTRTGAPAATYIATWSNGFEIDGDNSLRYSSGRVTIQANAPIYEINESDAAADNQRWWMWGNAGSLRFSPINDAGFSSGDYAQFTRSGNELSGFELTTGGNIRTRIQQNNIEFGAAESTIRTTDSFALSFGTNSTTRMTVGADGNITIAGAGTGVRTFNVGDSTQTTGDIGIQIGNARTGDGTAFLDFVTDAATYTDFGLRITREAGANGISQITHRGTGLLRFLTDEAASISFETNNITALTIDSTQLSTFNGPVLFNEEFVISTTNPEITIIDNNQPVDERRIDISGSNGNLTFFSVNDAGIPLEVLGTLNRSGTLISSDSIVTRSLGDDRYQQRLQTQDATVGTFRRVRPTESGTSYEMDNGGANTIEIIGDKDFAMTGATAANPVVITVASTVELETGDTVDISGVVGMTELNGNTYTITVINATTFSLDGIDGTGFTAYTSDGIAERQELTYPVGFFFEVIQKGAGTTTLRAGSGIPLNGISAMPSGVGGAMTAQFDVVRVRKMTSLGWIVDGDIGAIS